MVREGEIRVYQEKVIRLLIARGSEVANTMVTMIIIKAGVV